jgi:hypothetical protein
MIRLDRGQGKYKVKIYESHILTYQGLNHAITDAGRLVELISKTDEREQATFINDYELEMRKRSGEEVALSEMNTIMLHDWDRFMSSPLVRQGMRPNAASKA